MDFVMVRITKNGLGRLLQKESFLEFWRDLCGVSFPQTNFMRASKCSTLMFIKYVSITHP